MTALKKSIEQARTEEADGEGHRGQGGRRRASGEMRRKTDETTAAKTKNNGRGKEYAQDSVAPRALE